MRRLAIALLVSAIALTACARRESAAPAGTIRVGYFPNVTHAQALAGLARGDFARALGDGVTIETTTFNAGPSVIEAMFAGRIDLAYIGPNPAINGFVQSRGEALRIVAGATSGGASLVVRPESNIAGAKDMDGKRIASPQLGNTQDVALRAYLVANGLETREQGGTVDVIPTPNAQILDLARQGQIDGAWVPEPWASRLVVEAGCVVLVDERTLWPGGDFVTAHVIVRREYLEAHRDVVKKWLEAHVAVTRWMLASPDEALPLLNAEIGRLTGKAMPDEVIRQAWSRMRTTWDPVAPSLHESARAAHAAGFLPESPALAGIYDLSLLNEVLRTAGLPEITEE